MREEFFKQVCEILSHKFLAFPVKGGKTLGFMSNDLKHGENFAFVHQNGTGQDGASKTFDFEQR